MGRKRISSGDISGRMQRKVVYGRCSGSGRNSVACAGSIAPTAAYAPHVPRYVTPVFVRFIQAKKNPIEYLFRRLLPISKARIIVLAFRVDFTAGTSYIVIHSILYIMRF